MTAKPKKAPARKPRAKKAVQKTPAPHQFISEQTGKDPEDGRFLPGNRLWARRVKIGAPCKFETPIDLQNACLDYFEWAYMNPIKEERLFSSEGAVIRGETGRMQAMTVVGLCVHIGISRTSWYEYAARKEFEEVCQWATDVMYAQKFTGAAAGMLNPSIISRELGLAERTEVSGPDGSPIKTEEVRPRERIARKLARLAAAGGDGRDPGGAE